MHQADRVPGAAGAHGLLDAEGAVCKRPRAAHRHPAARVIVAQEVEDAAALRGNPLNKRRVIRELPLFALLGPDLPGLTTVQGLIRRWRVVGCCPAPVRLAP